MRKWLAGLCALFLPLTGCTPAAEEVPNTSTPTEEESLLADIADGVEKIKQLSAMRDLDEIFALEDDTAFAIALSSALCDWTEFGEHLDVISPEAQVFYLCNTLDAEVNNGGFGAFIYNSSGQWGPETVEALKTVGASQTAELLRQVIDLFACDEYPRDLIERNNVLLNASLGAFEGTINDAFFTYPDGLLQDLYISYARNHRDCFSAPEK